MKNESTKTWIISFGVFLVLSLLVYIPFSLSVPAYEESCKMYLDNNINDQELTDSAFTREQISCKNYFAGHPIYEYWYIYILIICVLGVIIAFITVMIIESMW